MNYNQILGVTQGATGNEIQQAFRKAAMEVHPDHSNSPEAAEAFARIKEARDELMKRAAEQSTQQDAAFAQQATASAIRSTTNAAYGIAATDDLFDGMTPTEVAHVQALDDLARKYTKKSFFARRRESAEAARHRKKLKTNERRLRGLY